MRILCVSMSVLCLLLWFSTLSAQIPTGEQRQQNELHTLSGNLDPIIEDYDQLAAGDNTLHPEEIAIPGTPPISRANLRNQIRLLEFVLQTRMTRAQKDAFLAELKAQSSELTSADRRDLMRASELFFDLRKLSNEAIEKERRELARQFAAAAQEFPDDPAAQLYTSIQAKLGEVIADSDGTTISAQDLEALAEWLAYAAHRTLDARPSPQELELIRQTTVQDFIVMPAPARAALSGFDRTWYRLQEAMAKLEPDKIAAALAGLPTLPTTTNTNTKITAAFIHLALQADAWKGILLEAGNTLNHNSAEWLATPTAEIW